MLKRQTEKLLDIIHEEVLQMGNDFEYIVEDKDRFEELVQQLLPRLVFHGYKKDKRASD